MRGPEKIKILIYLHACPIIHNRKVSSRGLIIWFKYLYHINVINTAKNHTYFHIARYHISSGRPIVPVCV
jgi:GT2 family glycosyltransferase